jgi:hypothetical protein
MLRLEALILDRAHIGVHVHILLQITHWHMQPTVGKTHTLVIVWRSEFLMSTSVTMNLDINPESETHEGFALQTDM